MLHTSGLRLIGGFSLLATTSVVFAHGHDDHAGETANVGPSPTSMSAGSMSMLSASTQSYFAYPALSGLMLAHIVVMTIAWFFVLPIGKYISRYAIPLLRLMMVLQA